MAKINRGDRFRLVNDLRVVRVGYDNDFKYVREEILEKYETKIKEFLRSFEETSMDIPKDAISRVAGGIAYSVVKKRMKDGVERKIYKEPIQPWEREEYYTVQSYRRCKTGKYYSPSYESSDWGYGGYFYEVVPGGLTEERSHLLVVDQWGYEFEECDIEIVK